MQLVRIEPVDELAGSDAAEQLYPRSTLVIIRFNGGLSLISPGGVTDSTLLGI